MTASQLSQLAYEASIDKRVSAKDAQHAADLAAAAYREEKS